MDETAEALRQAKEVIRELRQKLAIAGVEGSPPAEGTTIGKLTTRLLEAMAATELAQKACEQLTRERDEARAINQRSLLGIADRVRAEEARDAAAERAEKAERLLKAIQHAAEGLPHCDNPPSPQDLLDAADSLRDAEKRAGEAEAEIAALRKNTTLKALEGYRKRAEEAERERMVLRDAFVQDRNVLVVQRDALRAQLEEAQSNVKRFKAWLSSLLARIHRDGGQYQDQHGTSEACDVANEIVAGLYAERDALRAQLEAERKWTSITVAERDAERAAHARTAGALRNARATLHGLLRMDGGGRMTGMAISSRTVSDIHQQIAEADAALKETANVE